MEEDRRQEVIIAERLGVKVDTLEETVRNSIPNQLHMRLLRQEMERQER